MTATARAGATVTRLEDNSRVTIIEWRLPPGAETGWRKDVPGCVVFYRTAAKHIVERRDGLRALDVGAGQAWYRAPAGDINLINAGVSEVIFVEAELK